ncbi:hypothetical protein EVAR_20510_1 [Eumeta japonica]|uniref:Uncharacterized protein n=1 Tax=Eumeta variegata TaxID=151549 RepID=A0A4C1VKZ7_EUMVA|nr:hypothetical protein EVAR_20510_1 [Eumeta japonica]
MNLPETEEAVKEIDAEAEQPLEEGQSDDSAGSTTVQTSDTSTSQRDSRRAVYDVKHRSAAARVSFPKILKSTIRIAQLTHRGVRALGTIRVRHVAPGADKRECP